MVGKQLARIVPFVEIQRSKQYSKRQIIFGPIEMEQCRGLTKNGAQCNRKVDTSNGCEPWCYQHQDVDPYQSVTTLRPTVLGPNTAIRPIDPAITNPLLWQQEQRVLPSSRLPAFDLGMVFMPPQPTSVVSPTTYIPTLPPPPVRLTPVTGSMAPPTGVGYTRNTTPLVPITEQWPRWPTGMMTPVPQGMPFGNVAMTPNGMCPNVALRVEQVGVIPEYPMGRWYGLDDDGAVLIMEPNDQVFEDCLSRVYQQTYVEIPLIYDGNMDVLSIDGRSRSVYRVMPRMNGATSGTRENSPFQVDQAISHLVSLVLPGFAYLGSRMEA